MSKYVCADCGAKFKRDYDLLPVTNLLRRLEPGDTVPAGECPKCGAMVFLIEKKERIWTILVPSNCDNSPLCDIVYCSHKPTADEVKSVHDHLTEYDSEDFDIAEYSDPPTIL